MSTLTFSGWARSRKRRWRSWAVILASEFFHGIHPSLWTHFAWICEFMWVFSSRQKEKVAELQDLTNQFDPTIQQWEKDALNCKQCDKRTFFFTPSSILALYQLFTCVSFSAFTIARRKVWRDFSTTFAVESFADKYRLIHWLTNGMIDWLIEWVSNYWIDWSIDWLIDRLIVDWSIDRSIDWLIAHWIGRFILRSFSWLIDCPRVSLHRLIDWLIDLLYSFGCFCSTIVDSVGSPSATRARTISSRCRLRQNPFVSATRVTIYCFDDTLPLNNAMSPIFSCCIPMPALQSQYTPFQSFHSISHSFFPIPKFFTDRKILPATLPFSYPLCSW